MQQSQVNPDGSLKDFQSIYEYAFSYCCLRANLPDPASNSDLRGEVFAAFESILPLHIMPRFIGFSEVCLLFNFWDSVLLWRGNVVPCMFGSLLR